MMPRGHSMRRRALSLALALVIAPGAVAAFPCHRLARDRSHDQALQHRRSRRRLPRRRPGEAHERRIDARRRHLRPGALRELPRSLQHQDIIQAVSTDWGARGGTAGGSPSTAFSASFSCDGVSRLLCVSERAIAAAARDVPEYNLAVVIVNDTKYGGSGGDVPCASTNRQAAEICDTSSATTSAISPTSTKRPTPASLPLAHERLPRAQRHASQHAGGPQVARLDPDGDADSHARRAAHRGRRRKQHQRAK